MDVETRLMPPRRFYGHNMGAMIWTVMKDHSDFLRPLAPGERYLGAYIVPSFQRGLVWTERQKVRLIESIYLGLPIGSLVYNQTAFDSPCDRWLLDGQQRLSTICGYVAGEFAVNGWRYTDLPEDETRHFRRMTLGVIETQITSEDECRDIYDRLAYGGTAHT